MASPEPLVIRPYSPQDDVAAQDLERSCVQGKSLAVRFHRTSFAARTLVYSEAAIFCAWQGARLLGTVAAARKRLRLHGRPILATYFYDLRIHPEFRGQGLVHQLIAPAMDAMANDAECLYVLVAGQNEKMLGLLRNHYRFESEVVIPLTYVCLPVVRRRRQVARHIIDSVEIRSSYVRMRQPTFLLEDEGEPMPGYVQSVMVDGAGCSIWSNERILAEEVARLPGPLRALSVACRTLRPILPMPEIPRRGEIVRSWFLYDIFARTEEALNQLLRAVNDEAVLRDRVVLYLLLREDDAYVAWARRAHGMKFTFPYRFLARGSHVPDPGDRIHLDVRDL